MTSNSDLNFLGTRVKIHLSRDDNADRLSIVEHRIAPGFAPPLHVHRYEDETFYILEGRFRFERGDEALDASPGDTVHVPRGIRHGFRVVSDEAGRCLTFTRGGFEQAIRDVSRPVPFDCAQEPAAAAPATPAELGQLFSRNGIDLLGPPIA